ncbi:MAG: S8 family serine peptidase [Oceanococcus sp.]
MRNAVRFGLFAVLSAWLLGAQAQSNKVSAELMQKAADSAVSVVAEMADQADFSGAYAIRSKAAKGAFVVATLQSHAQQSQADVLSVLAQHNVQFRSFWVANVVHFEADSALLQAVAALDSVALIHEVGTPDFSRANLARPQINSKDGHVVPNIEPGLNLVGAPQVWDLGIRGEGAVVGDHDIGVEWQHPALKNQYRGWDGESADHAYNWRNAFGSLDTFCTDPVEPCDSNGHGTHTTGTMIGDDGAGMQIGMAPKAQWVGCRSLLDPLVGLGTLPTYLDCMEWFIAPYPEGAAEMADPSKAPDVINNSWGCAEACPPDILKAADEATKAAGIVQVGSAGNEGDGEVTNLCSTIVFPLAIYETTFTVGASDFDDQMASFSSRGPVLSDLSMRVKPNVVAPGVNVNSSDLDGTYGTKSGTSMASPHVAGLIALMISAEPRLRGQVDLIRQIIQDTSIPIETTEACGNTTPADRPNSVFGYGRIDALAAVLAIPSYFPEDEMTDGDDAGAGDASGDDAGRSNAVSRGGGAVTWLLLIAGLGFGRRMSQR